MVSATNSNSELSKEIINDTHRERSELGEVFKSKTTSKPASSNTSNANKRQYLYCIDTRQIIGMIEYSIDMLSVSMAAIR